MTFAQWAMRSRTSARNDRGFTLVELMVAVVGGLFVSVIVFAMARQGTRFYQQETRIAEATLAATIGMQRLRADIGRAGYMSSPHINSDPYLCMVGTSSPAVAYPGFTLLANMASVQISVDMALAAATDSDPIKAGIAPQQIQLSGAYQNSDRFIAGYMPPASTTGGITTIPLQPAIGALARYRYATSADQQGLLTSLFPTGRVLRLVNEYGRVAYGIIAGTTATGGMPAITLAAAPAIPLKGQGSATCVFAGVGVEVNVVNFYRYRIANLKNTPAYNGVAQFGKLFTSTAANPTDANRTELIREELNPTDGKILTALPEIIAEYAVDLRFELTATPSTGPFPATLLNTANPASGETVATIAGEVIANPGARAQRVRSVNARLSVRSREVDRPANIPSATGLYRIGIAAYGKAPYAFARVRTVRADIAVPNHFGIAW